MPDVKEIERVQRFRQVPSGTRATGRRTSGSQWPVAAADRRRVVESGRFTTRQEAITEALEAAFIRKELKTIM